MKQLSVFAILWVLGANLAWSDSGQPERPLRKRNLTSKEEASLLSDCGDVLASNPEPLKRVWFEGAGKLFIEKDSAERRSFDENDLLAAKDYAGQLGPNRRFTLLSSFQGCDIPAYDGMTEDLHGNMIRRVQLKTINKLGGSTATLRRAIEKAISFSRPRSWTRLAYLNQHDQYCFGPGSIPVDSHCFVSFEELKKWIHAVFSFFHISANPAANRSTVIVADLNAEEIDQYPSEQAQENLERAIQESKGAVSEIVFIKGKSATLHITARGSKWFPYRF